METQDALQVILSVFQAGHQTVHGPVSEATKAKGEALMNAAMDKMDAMLKGLK